MADSSPARYTGIACLLLTIILLAACLDTTPPTPVGPTPDLVATMRVVLEATTGPTRTAVPGAATAPPTSTRQTLDMTLLTPLPGTPTRAPAP